MRQGDNWVHSVADLAGAAGVDRWAAEKLCSVFDGICYWRHRPDLDIGYSDSDVVNNMFRNTLKLATYLAKTDYSEEAAQSAFDAGEWEMRDLFALYLTSAALS